MNLYLEGCREEYLMGVITVYSGKGGVGKSTLARFLSISIAEQSEQGKNVCIIDTCQNSSIATGFLKDRDSFNVSTYDWLTGAAKPSEVIQKFRDNIYYIPSDERVDDYADWVKKNVPRPKQLDVLRNKLEPLTKMFDFVILDTHPNENSDVVNYSISASNFIVIPTDIDMDGIISAERSVELVNEYKEAGYQIDYGIVFNKVEHKGPKEKSLKQLEMFRNRLIEKGIPEEKILGSIRYSQKVSTSKNEGIMLHDLKDVWSKNIMEDIRNISNKVLLRWKGKRLND